MSAVNRFSPRSLLCGAAALAAVAALSAQKAQADVLTYGAFETYVAGSTTWNGTGQYTADYYGVASNNTASGQNTEPLGMAYVDNGNNEYQYPIIVFQLANAIPAGQQITSAQVQILLAGNGQNPTFNASLDLLSVGSYAPNNDQFEAAGTRIATDLITPGSSHWVSITTNDTQSAALAADLNSANIQQWNLVTFRLTPDSQPDYSYSVGAQNWSGMNPVLTITTAAVPEPASLGLLGLGALALGGRRFGRRD